MSFQIVPLTNAPNQSFTTTLVVDGANLTLQLKVNYNEMAGYWMLAISDAMGNLLLSSIPMVCGDYPAGNLLGQYRYLAIGSAYVLNISNAQQDRPNYSNLGSDFLLAWGDTA